MQVIGAVTDDEQHPGGMDVAGQERDQIPGRAVGPVQILHHEHSRRHVAETHEEIQHPLEQEAARPRLAAGQPRQQRGEVIDPGSGHLCHDIPAEVAVEVPEDLDQRSVGQGARGDVNAPADGSRPPVPARPAQELLHQTGLAHTGVAGHDHQPPATYPGDLGAGRRELGQLVPPPDESVRACPIHQVILAHRAFCLPLHLINAAAKGVAAGSGGPP